MRVLYDPVTILTIASAAFSFIGGIAEGRAARADAENDARFLEGQANQEAVARRRDLEDLRKTRAQTLARSRAVLAAQGADTASGDALNILRDQASSFAIKENRLLTDSNTRQQSFLSRAANVRAGGKSAQTAAIFGGAGRAFSTGVSLFPGTKKVPKVSASRSGSQVGAFGVG